MSSLREKRRLRTEITIHRAAVDLAYEHGLDNVTTEMISDAADISPRTFFNYFPYKEAAYIPPAMEFDAKQIKYFITSKGDLIDDIIGLVNSQIDNRDIEREYVIKNDEITDKNPKLAMLKLSVFHNYDVRLLELLKAREDGKVDDDDLRHISALIMATIRVALDIWVNEGKGSLAENVSQRLKVMKAILEKV